MKLKIFLLLLLGYTPLFALDYYSNAGKSTSNWGPLGCGLSATGTWEVSGLTWYCMPTPASSHNAVIRAGHTKNHSAADTGPIEINKITIFGIVNLSRTGSGTNNIVDIVVESGGILNISAGTYNISGQILVKNGGTINVNGGTLRSTSSGNAILVNSGGIINMNGGNLNRAGNAVTLNVDAGGLININSGSGGMSLSSGTNAMSRVDGTVDCKNTLTSSNYSNFNFGETRVTINTSTGRIRSQSAYIPMVSSVLPPTFSNTFFGSNSDFGGTVEYYGSSSIFLGLFSRYYYYDLEVNCPNVYLYSSISYVRGNLYLKAGNLQLNDKIVRLMGGIVYTGSNFIGGSSNAELHLMGKLSTNTLESSGMTTYLINSQGSTYDIRYPQLKMSSSFGGNANLKVLRIKREDVVDIAYSNITVNTNLLLETGILKTSNTYSNHLYVSSTAANAITHNTTGYSVLASFVSGYLKRNIVAGNSYDFPVGRQDMMAYDGSKHRRMTLDIVSASGAEQLAVKFTNPATACTGTLTADEQGIAYTQIHPEGFWTVTPTNSTVTEYNENLYVNGFTSPALTDNMFFTVKRTSGSSACTDWSDFNLPIPTNGSPGRIFDSGQGFAKRSGHTTAFGEHAIAMTPTAPSATCDAPTLAVGTLSTSTAELTWTCAGCTGTFNVSYALTGATIGGPGWTTVSGASPLTITGLTPNTTYDAYVVQDCGATNSVESNVVTFTTNVCSTPTGLIVTASSTTSLSVSWTCVACTGTIDILYAPTGTTVGGPGWTTLSGTSPFTITGLSPSTAYDVYVVQDCGTGSSSGTTVETGTTLTPPCNTPTGITFSNITTTSASVSWACTACTGTFELYYALTGTTVGGPGWTMISATSPQTITGLTPNTAYDVYIIQNCGATSSPSSTIETFTTNCVTNIYYADIDNDGFGDPTNFISACSAPAGYVTDNTDCNDILNIVYPGAPELCDGIDNDCDTYIDESSVTWAKSFGASGIETNARMIIDAMGSIYTVGIFRGTVDFDPNVGVYNLTASASGSGYLTKIDADGNFIWAIAIGSEVSSLCFDLNGNILVTGGFAGNGGPMLNNLIASGSTDIFVANISNTGTLITAFKIGGNAQDFATGIVIDNGGNIYLTGFFYTQVDFDPSTSSSFILNSAGLADIFAAKYTSSGAFLWAQRYGGESYDKAWDIQVADEVYFTGWFSSNMLGGLTKVGGYDTFIAKLNKNTGLLIWNKGFGGVGVDKIVRLTLDASNNVYAVGNFSNTVDFDPNAGVANLSAVSLDGFILSIDMLGQFRWANRMGGAGIDIYNDLIISGTDIFVTGYFRGHATFNNSLIKLIYVGIVDDICVVNYSTSGNFIWAKRMGGANDDEAYGIGQVSNGDLIISGKFDVSTDMETANVYNYTLTSNGSSDVFVTRLNACFPNATMESETNQPQNYEDFARGITLDEKQMSVYPNPNNGYFSIQLPATNSQTTIYIYDLQGVKLYEQLVEDNTSYVELSLENLESGLYLIQLNQGDNMYLQKISIVK